MAYVPVLWMLLYVPTANQPSLPALISVSFSLISSVWCSMCGSGVRYAVDPNCSLCMRMLGKWCLILIAGERVASRAAPLKLVRACPQIASAAGSGSSRASRTLQAIPVHVPSQSSTCTLGNVNFPSLISASGVDSKARVSMERHKMLATRYAHIQPLRPYISSRWRWTRQCRSGIQPG